MFQISYPKIVNVATAMAILLTIAVALYALRLLIVGVPLTVASEIPLSEAAHEAPEIRVEYVPYPPAVIPLLAAAVLFGGLVTRQLPLAWIGLTNLITFSMLFVFSSGGGLLPVVGLLLLLLIFLTLKARKTRVRESSAQGGS